MAAGAPARRGAGGGRCRRGVPVAEGAACAVAVALAVAAAIVGAVSPALASIRLSRLLPLDAEGYIFGSSNYTGGGFVREAASHLGPSDTVLVHGSNILAFAMFSFSGARLAAYEDPTLRRNDLRIRFPDLAVGWQQKMADGGFRPDFTVVRADEAGPGSVVARGVYQQVEYALVREP